MWFLALCAVWTLGAIAWAAVALLTPAGDDPQEAVERKAGMHHDQHQPAGRYYIPTYAKVEKDGTAVLRYEVGNGQDSSVKDFLRTYDITAEPKRASPSEVTYSDRFGDVRRTFTITYNPSPGAGGYDCARITVRARGTDAS
ncbi:hypothetical protein [Streptomyces regalis]|uniref:Secreted protein n=1 Tax=Streptomyces regalis TaxID=68262 RepID=A0A117MLW2_9ACTN|nr:hypothetical protein [Streptomyces regalis]KUL24580.1 hypothetical protein ADL12_36245 [Streptomyces regalis]